MAVSFTFGGTTIPGKVLLSYDGSGLIGILMVVLVELSPGTIIPEIACPGFGNGSGSEVLVWFLTGVKDGPPAL